jgi:hypothetical protein
MKTKAKKKLLQAVKLLDLSDKGARVVDALFDMDERQLDTFILMHAPETEAKA